MVSDVTAHRRAFWSYFAEALPQLEACTVRGNETSRWLPVGPFPLIVAHYVGAGAVGIFVRGGRGSRIGHVRELLFPHRELIAELLGPKVRLGNQYLIETRLRVDLQDRANWPAAVAWFEARSPLYQRLLAEIQRSV